MEEALANYRKGLEDGLLRIMSKMGISTVDSYRGAQTFETLGLSDQVVETCFNGVVNRLPTVGFKALGRDILERHMEAYGQPVVYKRGTALPRSGAYGHVRGGEYHSLNPLVFNKLRSASSKEGGFKLYEKYSAQADGRPLTALRDALDYKLEAAGPPIPLEEVEDAYSIAKRFSTQAVSHGSISAEVHEVMAIAANKLGSRSNTGEGGEDPLRHKPFERDMPERSHTDYWHPKKGDLANSKIKQVASARFGVTPTYLVNAHQLEIKMAQGSKPGEGGHIPGKKVNKEIADRRFATPGMTLISPPPHHDIYSIEDLKQLIYDLKRVNKDAEVGVKLVSEAGIGTIAAGVVKANADIIQISGHDGGTGASPLSSIRNAGLPWELGLAEVQQVLMMNDLRDRVVLRVDGGIKTGRDVVMAALMGAEEYGFGTSALVALGCVMARKCHLNTCPVGIATQDPELRAKFKGKPEHVVTFLLHTAEQVRHELAALGLRSLDEAVGRVDLLRPKDSVDGLQDPDAVAKAKDFKSTEGKEVAVFPKGRMDLTALLHMPEEAKGRPVKCGREPGKRNLSDDELLTAGDMATTCLDEEVWRACRKRLDAMARHAESEDAGQPIAGAGAAADLPVTGPVLDDSTSGLNLHF